MTPGIKTFTSIKGDKIGYRQIQGHADMPCLVFLHEGLGCIDMWKGFPDELCGTTGCPGLIYDRLGYGHSSPDMKIRKLHYLHDAALSELCEVIEGVLSDQDYFLIGHSDGGSICLIHASETPNRLKGIIAEAPHIMVEPKTIEGIRDTVAAFDDKKHKALYRYHGEKTENVFNAWHETWLSEGFRHWNIEYLLPSILCPCLIIQGQDDAYATDRQAALIASKLIGSVQVEMIQDCGHIPHLESAGIVRRRMAAFIRDNTGAPSITK